MRKEDAEHKKKKMLPREIYDQIKFLTKIIALLYHDTPVLPVRIRTLVLADGWDGGGEQLGNENFLEIVIVLI